MITCTRCRNDLPPSAFRRDGRKRNGLSSWCRACGAAASLASHHKNKHLHATKPEKLARIKRWYENRQPQQLLLDRVRGVAKNTGICAAEVTTILLGSPPGAPCAVCGTIVAVRPALPGEVPAPDAAPTAHVDHCHDTGLFRGFLCGPCNTGIGMLGDDPGRVRRAADYLARFAIST